MRRLYAFLLASLTFLATFAARPQYAQVLYGSVVGKVQDQSGAAVARTPVSLTNPATGQNRETTADSEGRFSISNVVPGTYTLSVTAPGFRGYTKTGVEVTINTVTRADVSLEVGQVSETVSVAATAAALQTDKSDFHVELDQKAVANMPLGNYRNFQTLINLVPGATPGQFQNSITSTPARSLTTNINGTNRNSNDTRLDGALDIYVWLPHNTLYNPPADTIETVNIATNAFDAEQGLAGGAAVTVVTKSGTNQLHGTAFAFNDNTIFRARNFFQVGEKPKHNLNIDGGTIGGPIKKDKLFFFGGYEGTRERTGFFGRYTVPTADQRAGNFSAYSQTIYDPSTGNPNGSGRQPFAGNIVPLDRQSAITRKMQDRVPLPNLPGTANNYYSQATQPMNRDSYDVKVNWNRTASHMIWAKYSLMNADVNCKFALGDGGGPGLCAGGGGVSDMRAQLATIGHTLTLSPTLVIDGTLGFTRWAMDLVAPDYGQNWGSDYLGIPGTNGPDIRQSGFPIFLFNTYTTMGSADTWNPAFYRDQSFTHTTNVSWNRTGHDLRFGFDLVRHQFNHWQPEIGGGPRGLFNFTGGVTALNGGPSPNQYNSYADFLLGLPQTVQKSLQYEEMNPREWQFGWYFRDRWQVTPKLTLNLGIRYEYYPLIRRASRGIERYDPDTNVVLIGGRGGQPDDVGIDVSKTLFAPRVGFAWRVGENTVVRSGYGITYDPLPFSRPLEGPYPSTINGFFTGLSSFTPFQPIEQGIPPVVGPDLSGGSVPLPLNVADRSPWGGMLHRGYIQSWNFIIERKLPGDLVGTLGYVGTKSTHLLADRDINAAAPGTGVAGQPLYQTIGRTAATTMWDGWLDSNYHSLQTSVNRSFSKGFLLKASYTFSKAINQTDDDGWAAVMFNYPGALYRNRALAGYDRTHMFQAGYVLELPFGKGKPFASNGIAARVFGNWQLNGLVSAFTGTPFTVSASGASLNAPGNSQTADQVAPVVKLGGVGPGNPYYDPASFRAVTDARFGNTGRNILRAPGAVNTDLSVYRGFKFGERFNLEFRAEAFNLTNTPHFSAPAANVSGGNFLVITSATGATGAGDERQLRFGLHLAF
jgi:hypothetical protein